MCGCVELSSTSLYTPARYRESYHVSYLNSAAQCPHSVTLTAGFCITLSLLGENCSYHSYPL